MWVFSRFVRYFDEAARQGSMRKAGESLSVASTSIDRQVLRVESDLGIQLFERLPQGLRPTAAGELVLHAVRRWQGELQVLQSQIEDLKGLKRGEVVLGVVEGAAAEFIVGATMDFHASFPSVTFELLVYGAHRVTEAVLSGEVDFGLSINPRLTPGLAVAAQRSFYVGAVVGKDHPLSQRKSLRLSDCADFPLVVAEKSLDLRVIVDQVLAQTSANPQLIATSNSIMVMKELVMRGMGVGLMTEMDADKELRDGRLVYLPLADRPLPCSVLKLCLNRDRQLSLPAATLLQIVRSRLEAR